MRAWSFAVMLALATAGDGRAATSGYRVVDRIPGPDGGWDYVRVDAAHDRVLVARSTAVMAVSLKDRAVTPSLATGARLHDVLPVNGGAEILVTNGGTDTAVFADALTGATVATVHTGKGPDAAAYDARSGLVLVMDHAGGDITLIDPKAHRAVGSVQVGGTLEAAATDGAGRAYVNVEDRNEVAVVDIAARKVVGRYKLVGCDGPTGIAYDAADKLLLSACDGSTEVVQAATGRVVQTLATGRGADGVAWDARRRLAFVPAGRDGTLAVVAFDKGKASVVQTVQTQRGARTIALDERTGRLYLPTAQYGRPATPGGRPTRAPGTFEVLVVGR